MADAVLPDVLRGRVAWVFGDDFDVDLIIGVENIKNYDTEYLKSICMREFDLDFAATVRPGDLIVAGRNFGYGHPHYPAMIAMRAVGIVAVIAESFAPGFRRGETFNGMPLVTCALAGRVERWDELVVDWVAARVVNARTGAETAGTPPSQRTIDIVRAGGTEALLLREHTVRSRAATLGGL